MHVFIDFQFTVVRNIDLIRFDYFWNAMLFCKLARRTDWKLFLLFSTLFSIFVLNCLQIRVCETDSSFIYLIIVYLCQSRKYYFLFFKITIQNIYPIILTDSNFHVLVLFYSLLFIFFSLCIILQFTLRIKKYSDKLK